VWEFYVDTQWRLNRFTYLAKCQPKDVTTENVNCLLLKHYSKRALTWIDYDWYAKKGRSSASYCRLFFCAVRNRKFIKHFFADLRFCIYESPEDGHRSGPKHVVEVIHVKLQILLRTEVCKKVFDWYTRNRMHNPKVKKVYDELYMMWKETVVVHSMCNPYHSVWGTEKNPGIDLIVADVVIDIGQSSSGI
jgi:hypothetical protein